MMKNWMVLMIVLLGFACSKKKTRENISQTWLAVPVKYAKGFTIEKAGNSYRVTVQQPYKGATSGFTYYFYPASTTIPEVNDGVAIATPVESIVCTSTTHIPLLDYLQESDALVGFPMTDYISSQTMRKRINSGKVSELGIDEALNLEKLVELRPEAVMGYSLTGDLGQYEIIQQAGIPVILNAEYLETHPLGRAEWLKLAGILFNKTALADSLFNQIEKEYSKTQELVKKAKNKPKAISGVLYGDSWYLPGGKNYASTLLGDAGFSFFWEEDTTSAFLPLSFETVFDKGRKADFWIGVASFNTLQEIVIGDQRYTNFAAFKNGQVYSYNKLIGEKGGSEFLELGYLRPDLILKDLVKIAHPELLPEHELYFHFKLP